MTPLINPDSLAGTFPLDPGARPLRFDPLVILALPVVVFSLAVHECAHAVVAGWRGDRSARDAGRVTLDPRPHLDALGMLLVPGALLLGHAPLLLGWARPAPVEAALMRDPRRDRARVALAGPLAHLVLALVFAGLARLLPAGGALAIEHRMAEIGVTINLGLACFHLVPLPPLDGAWLLMQGLRLRHILMLYRLRVAGFVALAVLVLSPVTAPALLNALRAGTSVCLAAFGVHDAEAAW